jgi:hypothetical protein
MLEMRKSVNSSLMQKLISLMDCQTNSEVLMSVTVGCKQLKIVCIHPKNDSYPIFSIVLQKKVVKFLSKFDHDEISVKLGNMEIIDHTNYPKTLDPTKKYSQRDEI